MGDFVETFQSLPAPTGTTSDPIENPDSYTAQSKLFSNPYITNINLQFGKTGGKNHESYSIFVRFEVGVPEGATITAVSVNFFANGGGDGAGGPTIGASGGFLNPQADALPEESPGGNWQDALGVVEWTTPTPTLPSSRVPFAEWQGGNFTDYSVFHGGARAFANVEATIQASNGGSFSFGEGVSAHTSVTGLVDQLQGYIDDNEALRDHTLDGHIPAMFHLYSPWSDEEEHWQGIYSADAAGTSSDPSLTVHYSTPIIPRQALVGSGTSTQTSEGSGVSTLAAEGIGTSTQEIAGEGVSTTSMTGSGTSKTELEGG